MLPMGIRRDCSAVITKEREILDASDITSVKTCLNINFSDSKRRTLKKYFDICDEISDLGIHINKVYKNYPKSCVAVSSTYKDTTPISNFKKNSPIRQKVMDYIFECCANDIPVDTKTYNKLLGDWRGWSDDMIKEHCTEHVAQYMISRRISIRNKNKLKLLPAQITPCVLKQRDRNVELGAPHHAILHRMIEKGFGADEYAAFCIAMKWASERISGESNV